MSDASQHNNAFSTKDAPPFTCSPQITSTMAIEALGKFFSSPNLLSKKIAQEALEAHYQASVAAA